MTYTRERVEPGLMGIPTTGQGESPYPDLPLTDRMFSVSLKSGRETLESKKEPIH